MVHLLRAHSARWWRANRADLAILEPAGGDPDQIAQWVLPWGIAGAVIVAAWLVESKQRVIENMAPVLTMVFTPLFALMLAIAAVATR